MIVTAPVWDRAKRIPTLPRCAVVYSVSVLLPVATVVVLLRFVDINSSRAAAVASASPASAADTAADPVGRVLVAATIVVLLAALFGMACRAIRLSAVLGEMVAGILLGPSALGVVAPHLERNLFPPGVVSLVSTLAQVGVVFFMFIIGLDLPLELLRRVGRVAVLVGHAAVAVPLAVGAVLALGLQVSYSPPGMSPYAFRLFVALSVSVTAFPVLARIIRDTGLADTAVGVTGIAAAGIGDITAWCVLGVVVAEARSSSQWAVLRSITLTAVFTIVLWSVGRPALAWSLRRLAYRPASKASTGALIAAFVLGCASLTNWFDVHAIFGAFLAGLVMPRRSAIVADFRGATESFTLWVFLPLFFATIGLQSRIQDAFSGRSVLPLLAVLGVAIAGKTFGAGVTGALSGLPTRESLVLAVMMSCRGLTELIILSVGRTLGIIEIRLFSMLVVMTVVTTAMTDPLLRLLTSHWRSRPAMLQQAG